MRMLTVDFLLVYLFIGEHIALVDFVKALHEVKEVKPKEYMVISIDDFIYDPESNAQEYTSRSKIRNSQRNSSTTLDSCAFFLQ